jgi:hypothetical protein
MSLLYQMSNFIHNMAVGYIYIAAWCDTYVKPTLFSPAISGYIISPSESNYYYNWLLFYLNEPESSSLNLIPGRKANPAHGVCRHLFIIPCII